MACNWCIQWPLFFCNVYYCLHQHFWICYRSCKQPDKCVKSFCCTSLLQKSGDHAVIRSNRAPQSVRPHVPVKGTKVKELIQRHVYQRIDSMWRRKKSVVSSFSKSNKAWSLKQLLTIKHVTHDAVFSYLWKDWYCRSSKSLAPTPQTRWIRLGNKSDLVLC